ncbi:protein-tyrosine-phosphatase MKP1-like isoform X2 [Telopea speciosissima]|uniref:protein-tyrosine-phosphatase MKP1-like isoform X2 n=1 Tax=Telopea speciosissima TaxID=54955 RepID=UPI001CC48E6E|nr:protein-tyrosine-phosphatase MKP1-like isoform X2 [Telopea speciosissima]
MVGDEEDAAGSRGQCQISGAGGGGRKAFWRSASWSSRSASQSSAPFDHVKDFSDPHNSTTDKNNGGGQFRRFPVPLTPRSQHSKARSCLPPLQPLSITRRGLDEWPKAGSDDVGEWPQPPTPSGRGDPNKPIEGLKLDLSSFQRNPDPTGTLLKKDRIAFFDKECSKVAEHIYLGGDAVAKNRDILKQNGITHVLNCVGFVCPEYFKSDLVYKTLWLQDSPSEDITSILYDVFDYFEDVREQGGRVLVHCCQGVSRSTSLVIAYLMWREGQSFDDAFQFVKQARGIANPNMGFACQLLQCQKRVHAIPLSPSSVLRMYRMAPHSPYDPLHLVPKMLNDPSPSALDSRGAFIVHVPSAIYIWVGRSCQHIMERDAKGAAFQVVRYERVQAPRIMVEEGEEPSDFWDAFSNLPDSVDKSGNIVKIESAAKVVPGERKVDSYDGDFEVFQKAITGGVVPAFSTPGAEHETHLPARESNWSVLRRKFALGDVKEFGAGPKVSLCRVYSDSMLIFDPDSRINKLPHLSADSSSSPHFSPSSFSSDSSNSSKSSSESPSLSPSTSSSTASPASSTVPDLPSKTSLHPIPNISESRKVGHASCSQVISSPSKRLVLSLAERRGSLSPSLKLQTLADDKSVSYRRDTITYSTSSASQQNEKGRDNNSCSFIGLCSKEKVSDSIEATAIEKGDSTQECQLQMFLGASLNDQAAANEGSSVKKYPLQEVLDVPVFAGFVDNFSGFCNPIDPIVCRWPTLERVAPFGTANLDSEAAFLVLVPSTGVGKHKDRMIYFWIGKSFKHDNCQLQLDVGSSVSDVEAIDWNQVVCDFLSTMGLPKDIPTEDR